MNDLIPALIQGVVNKRREVYNPIYLYGAPDMLTSVLDRLSAEYAAKTPKDTVVRITGAAFAEKCVHSLIYSSGNLFLRELAGSDMLILGDIEHLCGMEYSMQRVYGLFDKLWESNRQIVVTGACPPWQLPRIAPRIQTQLEGGIILKV